MRSTIGTTKMFGLDDLALGKLADLRALIASISLSTPGLAETVQDIGGQLSASSGARAIAGAAWKPSTRAIRLEAAAQRAQTAKAEPAGGAG